MLNKHKWNFRVHLLFVIAALAAIFGFQPERMLTAEIVTGPIEVYKVKYQEEEPLHVSKWTQYEVSKILDSITTMKAASHQQLPETYLLFKFEREIVLEDSPVPFAFKKMIVTMPSSRWQQPEMLLQNSQGQWIRYETSHPLTMLTRDYR